MTDVAFRPDSLSFISLCTGGGGLDLGVELAIPDARAVVLVEGEAWSVATLVSAMEARLLAPAPVWSDVRTFDGRPWRGLVDGLIGDIPCQPHSLAGKRKGEDDERDLWSPTRRIVVQSRPWFVLIENVRGMLSGSDGKTPGAERVWRDLQRIGYAVEFGIFTAEEVGASHQRERVFILAVADHAIGRWRLEQFARGSDGTQRPDRGCSGDVADADAARLPIYRSQRSDDGPPEPELRSGWDTASSASAELADTSSQGRRPISIQQGRQDEAHADAQRCGAELGTENMADTASAGRRSERTDSGPDAGGRSGETLRLQSGRLGGEVCRGQNVVGLFPPGPSDLDGWRRVLAHSPQLEPAVRRMADGVAARLDLAGPHAARIERLRMLGNGVVSLEAAYALRALATRLAERSAGAAELVRMMVTT